MCVVDYNEILTTMENAYKEKTGFVPDEYSDQGIKFRILAGELFNFSSQLDFWKSKCSLQLQPVSTLTIIVQKEVSPESKVQKLPVVFFYT